MKKNPGHDSWWLLRGTGLQVKTLFVLIVLQTCIKGIEGEAEVLHGDMQLLQLGGRCWVWLLYMFSTISLPSFDHLFLQVHENSHVNHNFSHLYNLFHCHVILPCFVEYYDTIFLFVANWGENWRSILEPLLFFRCFLWGQGYGVSMPRWSILE